MKKVISFFLILFVFAFLMQTPVLAVEKIQSLDVSKNSEVAISYELPYPGMLPDSSFYFLKEIRDKVIGFLITSNVNKSFYSLLLSDKRLSAGQILVDTGKSSLGVKAISQGEEFFSKAVDSAAKAKSDKLETTELFAKLSVASVKHQEVVANLLTKVSGEEKSTLSKAYSDSQNSQNRVHDLMKSNK